MDELTGTSRRELAVHLHDNLAQLLVALRMKTGLLARKVNDEPARQMLREIDELSSEALQSVRSLITHLQELEADLTTLDSSAVSQTMCPPETTAEQISPIPTARNNHNRFRVLLVDDHQAVRRVMKRILEADPAVELVGEVISGDQAVEMVGTLRPDVVLMDAQMAGLDGIEATRQIISRFPAVRVVGLSAAKEHDERMKAAGASAFLLKGCPSDELHRAICGEAG